MSNMIIPSFYRKNFGDNMKDLAENIRKSVRDRINDSGLSLHTVITASTLPLTVSTAGRTSMEDLLKRICGISDGREGLERIATMHSG